MNANARLKTGEGEECVILQLSNLKTRVGYKFEEEFVLEIFQKHACDTVGVCTLLFFNF